MKAPQIKIVKTCLECIIMKFTQPYSEESLDTFDCYLFSFERFLRLCCRGSLDISENMNYLMN